MPCVCTYINSKFENINAVTCNLELNRKIFFNSIIILMHINNSGACKILCKTIIIVLVILLYMQYVCRVPRQLVVVQSGVRVSVSGRISTTAVLGHLIQYVLQTGKHVRKLWKFCKDKETSNHDPGLPSRKMNTLKILAKF